MERIETSQGVQQAIAEQYGAEADLTRPVGVLHVTSVWSTPDGRFITLKIGPHSPQSPWDFFALNLARARADAIVVTGKILRDEPNLRYDLDGEAAEGLARWRTERLRKFEPPTLAILTSGKDFDPDHPALHGLARPVVYTSPEGAERIGRSTMEMVTHGAPTLPWALEDLKREGAGTVTIEAGPGTSSILYGETVGVDELMLSRFESEELREDVVGGVLMTAAFCDAKLEEMAPAVARQEASGLWRFSRLRPR